VCFNERFVRPGVDKVELGTALGEIVERLGGGLRDGGALRALQVGGPLGGFLGPADLDLPLLDSALSRAGGPLGHGSLVAVDDRVKFSDLLRHFWEFAAKETCGACTPCREGTREVLHTRLRPRRTSHSSTSWEWPACAPSAERSHVRSAASSVPTGAG
jgi:NADH:ubiquinone oxidoreductase subunit F (NADH-binding)